MEWDINDATIPNTVNHYDPYQDWPDDHIRLVYPTNSEPARRHASGWAMRNTNNHNVHILKKSCLGVLMCSRRCKIGGSSVSGELRLRPAICDKARKKQLGRQCPNPKCGGGSLILVACKGNSGFPCTHFWRHTGNAIFFQAKGIHDHPRPEVKNSNLEVRKTIGVVKVTSASQQQQNVLCGGRKNNVTASTNLRSDGKTGRKMKRIKKETCYEAVRSTPLPRSTPTTNCNKKPPTTSRATHPYQLHRHQQPKLLPPPQILPESNNHNLGSLTFPSTPDYTHTHPLPHNSSSTTKPSFPEWYYPPQMEEVVVNHPQQKLYPSSSTICAGCNQPHFYCSCGYHHQQSNPDFLQQPDMSSTTSSSINGGGGGGGGGFISFNNNQDTFKPSDIFNFEVNLNLNYSAYTTNHHYHNPNSQVGTPTTSLATTPSYYGSESGGGGGGEEQHFIQPHPSYPNRHHHHHHHPSVHYNNPQFYNGGTDFYDGWSNSNNNTVSNANIINNATNNNSSINSGTGMMY